MNTTGRNLPPYPRLGEIYRTLAKALDTKASNRAIDRLAQDGDFDWSLLPTLREELVTTPLQRYTDDEFAALVDDFIGHVHGSYLRLVTTVPLDSLSRQEALPLLVINYFSLHGAGLLFHARKAFGGPDLMELMDETRNPLDVVMGWADENGARSLAKAAYPGTTDTDKTDREKVMRWARGTQPPDITGIHLFQNALAKNGTPVQKARIPDLRRWLVLARAVAWLEGEAAPIPIRTIMRRYLLSGLPEFDIGRTLSMAVCNKAEDFTPLVIPALSLFEDLKRTTPKAEGDQARTKLELKKLEELTSMHDPEGRTHFHLEQLKGRWQVLSGKFEEALPYYEKAAELANYRGGENERQILEEALVLAAYLGDKNKALLKRLKHRAIVFGLFFEPVASHVLEVGPASAGQPHPGHSSKDVIQKWEIDHLRGQFQRVFPPSGCFPEADLPDTPTPLPFLLLNSESLDDLKPDLSKPDRVVAVHLEDEQKRRYPQLRLFAFLGRWAEMEALLQVGASVDQLDESGASALLCAIQHAEATGDRTGLDLLLQYPHRRETLDRITVKKQLTPLFCAIEYGEPDVVEKLLGMGATADRRGNIVIETPLYRCISMMQMLRKPLAFRERLRGKLLKQSNIMQREVMRRYAVGFADAFGDYSPENAPLSDSRHRAIFDEALSVMVERQLARHSIPKLTQIAKFLLEHGAKPNAAHDYPEPGRTPLMLAAENDSVEAFDAMLTRDGDPYLRDKAGVDCLQIATSFRSMAVIRHLRSKGVL